MSPREYIPGDTVFAKLKGYPWWPARVENDKDIPAKILKQKGKSKGLLYTVFFYGSRDYGFFGPDCVRPFDRATVERDLKAKKFKTKDLEIAIHQALDPSILKAEEKAENEEEDDNEEEKEEEEEEVVEKPKRKTPAAKKATDKKKKAPVNNKRKIKQDEDETSAKKSRVGSDTEDNVAQKRRKSLSIEQEEDRVRESSTVSRNKSEEPSKSVELELFKKTTEYKKIYHIRHKLQKLVYEKKPGEIQKEDYVKVSQVVKEIEDASMTFDLLRYTKIGKVVKFACSYDYDQDEFKINQRCQQLMKNWKSLIMPDNNRSSADIEQPPTHPHHS